MRQSPYRTNAPPPPDPPEPFDLRDWITDRVTQLVAFLVLTARTLAFAAVAIIPALWACTPQEARDARDAALSAESIACIMNSTIVHDAELAKACTLADKLIPVVHDLIGVREAGKRVGVVYRGDGGTPVQPSPTTGACPPAAVDAGAIR